jgi:hypothetical protein
LRAREAPDGRNASGWGSAVAAQITNVFVTNTSSNPVPVQAVGTLPVHEQGTATVNVTNTPLPVKSADTTKVIFDQSLPQNFTDDIDTEDWKEIRVFISLGSGICITSRDAAGALLAPQQCYEGTSVLLELPPPKIKIVSECSQGCSGFPRIVVIGRTN